MGRILNTVKENKDGVIKLIITKTTDMYYYKECVLDEEVYLKLNGRKVYVNGKSGYPILSKVGHDKREPLAHYVMEHTSQQEVVVDHINGDRLDNRKSNLRITTMQLNNTNRLFTKNNTGVQGVAERTNGNYNYFRASVSDLKTTVSSTSARKGTTKRYSKQFNINKLGRTEALKQATEWIQAKKIEFGYLKTT